MFRRRSFRRRRFGRRAVARKEPIWITTAFSVTNPANVLQQNLFQLIGPEDYTPDYATEINRKDKCTLVRTVGGCSISAALPADPAGVVEAQWKAALFVGGDKQVEDGFAQDPGQFDIVNAVAFMTFCRDFSPLQVWWTRYYNMTRNLTGGTASAAAIDWIPPTESPRFEWDVNVKRRLEGDDVLFLLINVVFLQSPVIEFGGAIEIESRNLIMDQ